MEADRLHGWDVSVSEALEIQRRLAKQLSRRNEVTSPRFIAGVDISVREGQAAAAVVVLTYPEMAVVETRIAAGKIGFPYVPGLLSFRECPLIMAAYDKLDIRPGLILVDGQGVAHPRRMGLASHLGLLLDTPSVGCAKTRLCGQHQQPDELVGSWAALVDGDETIGAVLRTRQGVKPVYVSIGHKVDLQTAVHWVKECCRGYRLPEPTRLAHLAAGGSLKPGVVKQPLRLAV